MTPVIASGGRSFKGAFAYYMHDKNASTTARIAWTHTMNMMTDCVKKAWKVMAYTAKAQQRLKEVTGQNLSGKKLEKPVFAYSLSWHPEQKPDKEAMLEAAQQSLEKLGFTEHEVAIAAHNDEPHPHIHIVVNRVHPVTGMAAKLDYTKRKLSAWALEYEQQQGKVYCMKREENHQKRQQGQNTKYVDPVIDQAWSKSSNAQGFKALLESKGYKLAQGRKRLVVVDPYDKAHNPTRHIEGVRSKEFQERMADIEYTKLPTVEAVIGQRKIERKAHENEIAKALSQKFSQHYEEWETTRERHNLRIDNKTAKLEDFYKLTEQQAKINQIKHQLENPGLVRKFTFKIFRTDRKLVQIIETLEINKANAKHRLDEAINLLVKERDQDLQRLEKRHAREIEKLTNHFKGKGFPLAATTCAATPSSGDTPQRPNPEAYQTHYV